MFLLNVSSAKHKTLLGQNKNHPEKKLILFFQKMCQVYFQKISTEF